MKYLANINVNHDLKLVWIAPERTGSRTQSIIFSYCGFKNNGKPVYFTNNYNYNHNTVESEIPEGYEIICGARNPYERVYSIYSNLFNLTKKVTFESSLFDWVDKGHHLQMVKNPELKLLKPKYLIRLEHFHEDFSSLPFISDYLSERQLKMLLIHGKESEEAQPMSDKEKSKILEFCEPHFDMWGYEK